MFSAETLLSDAGPGGGTHLLPKHLGDGGRKTDQEFKVTLRQSELVASLS